MSYDEQQEQLVGNDEPLTTLSLGDQSPQVVQYIPLPQDYTGLSAQARTAALTTTLNSLAVGIHVLFTILSQVSQGKEEKSELRIITP